MFFETTFYTSLAINIIIANAVTFQIPSGYETTPANSFTSYCFGKQYWDNGFRDFKDLSFFAFKDFNFDSTLAEICKKSENAINNLTVSGICFTGNEKQFFDHLMDGFKKDFKMRCTDKAWYENLLKYKDCLRSKTVSQRIITCMDRSSMLMAYIVKYIPKQDQADVMCCYASVYADCDDGNTKKSCGSDAAKFVVETIFAPYHNAFAYLCKGMKKEFCSKYPNAKEDAIKVFSTKDYSTYGNVYEMGMKIAEDSINA